MFWKTSETDGAWSVSVEKPVIGALGWASARSSSALARRDGIVADVELRQDRDEAVHQLGIEGAPRLRPHDVERLVAADGVVIRAPGRERVEVVHDAEHAGAERDLRRP